jgi:hypothetical protein
MAVAMAGVADEVVGAAATLAVAVALADVAVGAAATLAVAVALADVASVVIYLQGNTKRPTHPNKFFCDLAITFRSY